MVEQSALGFMHGDGRWVTQDYVEAHKWCTLAAAGGVERARITGVTDPRKFIERILKSRDRIAKKMTPEQIAEAEKRARKWRPKKAASK